MISAFRIGTIVPLPWAFCSSGFTLPLLITGTGFPPRRSWTWKRSFIRCTTQCDEEYNVHLRQQCHNSRCVIFQEGHLKALKCYNFLCVKQWHNCSPAASFANCLVILCLLKVYLPKFISNPVTQKWQILSCDTLVANERYIITPDNHKEGTWYKGEYYTRQMDCDIKGCSTLIIKLSWRQISPHNCGGRFNLNSSSLSAPCYHIVELNCIDMVA